MFTDRKMQDVLTVVLGAVAALSPVWVGHNDDARWSLVVLGAVIALGGLAHLAGYLGGVVDYVVAVAGVLLFISPWVMGFTDYSGASWFAWVVGAVTTLLAVTSLPQVSSHLHTAH
ncbi:SPW repeat protein [Nocardia sp. 2]|uniref:SPW repeat protein n=1 Tax=Nocardia acididurans TaxID=2802282 RepID=A0ABS1M4T8_9NOCA|nr:SPW repeat protein [Nocardia acididurans]MBL1075556.1 SPW repeat protein [Nocardia acididurans]